MKVTIVTDRYGDWTYGVYAGSGSDVIAKHFPGYTPWDGRSNSYFGVDADGFEETIITTEHEVID